MMTPDEREDITYELNRELGNAEQREINRRVEWARAGRGCTCHPVPERYHTTHYGATEPGSTLEPDYDCPVHFPPDATVIANAAVHLRNAEKEVGPIT